ncbi:MAG: YbhB/YbcL family Raf kinase inhibitor-like protein [Gammaproteobacteria bacterium]|nr:YbhB/YbcL family Raf kinase inhibitor-like protein [Gammaproteobacteria bacterium]
MQLTSPGFHEGERIPWRYSAPGANELPPLEFREIPRGARSLALVFENLDSPLGPATHWLAWNIPPGTPRISAVEQPANCVLGTDTFGKIGYTGPAPPEGRPRFRFTLFALEIELDLAAGATRQQFDKAIDDHVIETAELTGYAERPDSADSDPGY